MNNLPSDVRTVVVTDHPDDLLAGIDPDMRLLKFLPNATLLSEGRRESFFVRAFEREPYKLPTKNLERRSLEPYAKAEERLLAEVERRLGPEMLPTRTDGWAYAVDVGNLLLYAAERGDAELFARMDAVVREHYLTTDLADPRALYTVAWRVREDREAEASGTTETLRVLEGYVAAAERRLPISIAGSSETTITTLPRHMRRTHSRSTTIRLFSIV